MVKAVERRQSEELSEALEGQHAYTPEEARPDNIPPGTRVRVIVNPASGKKGGITTNAAGPDEVRRLLEENGIQADIVETEYPRHATELAKNARKDGYDIVVACGGDGTMARRSTVSSAASDAGIPLGSANNVPHDALPFDRGRLPSVRLGELSPRGRWPIERAYFRRQPGPAGLPRYSNLNPGQGRVRAPLDVFANFLPPAQITLV